MSFLLPFDKFLCVVRPFLKGEDDDVILTSYHQLHDYLQEGHARRFARFVAATGNRKPEHRELLCAKDETTIAILMQYFFL